MDEYYKQRLKRLPQVHYKGHAWVHWTLTMDDRKKGWLDAKLLYKFRELLTHTMFRYQAACPIYCLMPDHMHLMWTGLAEQSNQSTAMKAFRVDLNDVLSKIGFQLQLQPYDHVMKDSELERGAIEATAEYIARNPERKGLVKADEFAKYPYTGCLLPGAARLRLFTERGWDEIWRTLAILKRTECFRRPDPKYEEGSV